MFHRISLTNKRQIHKLFAVRVSGLITMYNSSSRVQDESEQFLSIAVFKRIGTKIASPLRIFALVTLA